MRNKQLCDSCTYWEEIGLGHVGTCNIQKTNTKWSETCKKYNKKATKIGGN